MLASAVMPATAVIILLCHISVHACRVGSGPILIENVQLFSRSVLLEKLGGNFSLGSKDYSICGKNAQRSAGVRDGFESIFDLVEAAFGREDCCLMMVNWQAERWVNLVTLESYRRDIVAER